MIFEKVCTISVKLSGYIHLIQLESLILNTQFMFIFCPVLRRDLINEWLEAPGTNAPGSATYPETYAAGPYDILWNRIDKMNLDSGKNFKGQLSYSLPPTASRKLLFVKLGSC
jgi:hypothetical protein